MESGISSGGTASASQRAEELRASLGARRDVEALLAEASAARHAAAAEADALVEEAQQLSAQLLAESNAEAERTTLRARERAESLLTGARTEAEEVTRQARAAADAVRARAETEVEDHRRRVRAEVIEQITREVTEASRNELARLRQQSGQMIGDLEASVRILGVSLEAALANTGDLLAALEGLRTHTVESLGQGETPPPSRLGAAGSDPDLAAEGRLLRASFLDNPSETAVPAGASVFRVPGESEPADDPVAADAEAPRTATEAYLRSSHLDHDDPPLPPLDDSDVGDRYARDASARRTRTRREHLADHETLEVMPAHERGRDEVVAPASDRDADPAGRPLGWLFRSSP